MAFKNLLAKYTGRHKENKKKTSGFLKLLERAGKTIKKKFPLTFLLGDCPLVKRLFLN